MSLRKAIVVACLLVLPGVVLRVAPYLDRLDRPRAPIQASASVDPQTGITDLQSTPSRLSQRPLPLVAVGFAVEVAILVVAITVLLHSRWLLSLLTAVSLAQQAVRLLLFTTLVAGFLAGSQDSFPFVAWRMYSGISEQPPSAYLFTGVTRNGASIPVKLGEVFPMLGPHRGYQVAGTRITGPDAEQQGDAAALTTALQAVGHAYNLRHPHDPLARLSVTFVTIPLDNHEPPWVRDEHVVAGVEIE